MSLWLLTWVLALQHPCRLHVNRAANLFNPKVPSVQLCLSFSQHVCQSTLSIKEQHSLNIGHIKNGNPRLSSHCWRVKRASNQESVKQCIQTVSCLVWFLLPVTSNAIFTWLRIIISKHWELWVPVLLLLTCGFVRNENTEKKKNLNQTASAPQEPRSL